MRSFDHEKLDVYRVSIEFVILTDEIIESFPRGKAYFSDQLQRACTSITLNIAEGSDEYCTNEKIRFYRIAKRSATECASIIDVLKHLKIIDDTLYQRSRELLFRIVSMLIKMVQK